MDIVTGTATDEEKVARLHASTSLDLTLFSGDWATLVSLILLERRLGTDPLSELDFRSVQPKTSNDSFLQTYNRFKYQDLYSDYQLSLNTKLDKTIELINKKVFIIKQNTTINLLNKVIYMKVFNLLMISQNDFRKNQIILFLENCPLIDFNSVPFFDAVKNNKIILPEFFGKFLSTLDPLYLRLFKNFNYTNLITNLIERNLICLTKYYNSIEILKLYSLLDISQEIDLSNIITSMIIADKFPGNCKIDGINNLIIFDDNTSKKTLNDHVLTIGTLLTDIVKNINNG